MDRIILRISCVAYIASISLMMWLVFNPPAELPVEIQAYMQWWYSQENNEIEAFVTNLSVVVLALTLIGVIGLFFLKKWGGYLFLVSALLIIGVEPLLSNYAPRTSLETTLDSVASASIGCILVIMLLSAKLKTFEHNKRLQFDAATPRD